METTQQKPHGRYFVFPMGGAWKMLDFQHGRETGAAYQSDMGSHAAAQDRYADLDPDDATEEVPEDVVRQIVGPDADPECFVVMRVPDSD